MDFVALIVGAVVGLIIGFGIAWIWASSVAANKNSHSQNTEDELKALLAQRANHHLQTSKASVQSLQQELGNLLSSINDYENSLVQSNEDQTKSTFFGEHASMFLRNTEHKSGKSIKLETPDNQPKDFANNGSGLFAGNAVIGSENSKEN